MLRYRMRPLFRATILACGSFLLFQAGDGATCTVLAQSREVLAGFSGRVAPTTPDWLSRGSARRQSRADQQAARELEDAREILSLGSLLEGRRRLEVLVARYPDAAASEEARRELARLYASPVELARANPGGSGPGQGSGAAQKNGDSAVRVPVSLGAPAPSGNSAPAQATWLDEPRLARAAEQDFRLYVGDRVFFGDRNAELGSRARALLAAQAHWLKQVPQATVIIEGHADDQGSAAFNQELAARRAGAVRDRLIAEGVEATRITLAVYGRQQPVALCQDGECAAQNRRVVTVLRSARPATGAIMPRPGPASDSTLAAH
jgi:outer membrane protein OmpA-like peptidoglycan-associated protein